MKNNRLQFRHHSPIFETREKAIQYISGSSANIQNAVSGLSSIDPSLGLSLYAEPTILSYGDETNPHIMFAIGSVTNSSSQYANNKFCIIDIDKTEEEIANIEEELEKVISSLTIVVNDSKTLNLFANKEEDGTYISGDVKVAESHLFDDNVNRFNNLMTTEDGLFIFVNLTYDENAETFTFTVTDKDGNLNETSVKLPNNHVVSGMYMTQDETIHLKMKEGDDVVIDVKNLVNEWTVEDKNDRTPIELTKERIVESGQDVLKADLRLIESDTNIITIKNYDGGNGGLFASVNLDYVSNENTLVFTTSNGLANNHKIVKSIPLNTVDIVKRIYYDDTNEEIVIIYVNDKGEEKEARIPVSGIIEEWDVNNEDHNVLLEKKRNETHGKDMLSADVKISPIANNILEDNDHKLYVRGEADNIKYGDTTVKGAIDTLKAEDETLNGKIETIEDEIGDGFGARNTIRDEINKLQGEIDTVSGDSLSSIKDVINNDKSIDVDKSADATKPIIKVNLSNEIEDSGSNIIKLNSDGLFAGVDLVYEFNEETGSNQLIFKTTNGTKTYNLKTNSIVDKIYYDPTREAIIIEYTVNGHRMPDVVVPVRDLIDEWDVSENTDGAIRLVKTRVTSGSTAPDILSAETIISTIGDNILVNADGALYVSGQQISDNKASIEVLQEQMTTAEGNISSLDNRMDTAESNVTRLQTNLADEIARSTDKDNELNGAINTETTRAERAEHDLSDAIGAEQNRAVSAETSLSNAISSGLTDEKNRAERAEHDLSDAIGAEQNRAVSAETALSNTISSGLTDEKNRAENAESALNTLITTTVSAEENRAKGVENTLSGKTDILSSTTSSLTESINAEQNRATSEETRLDGRIDDITLSAGGTNTTNMSITNKVIKTDVIVPTTDNIIIVDNGIKANVNLTYDSARNSLKFEKTTSSGIVSNDIALNAGSIVDDIYYKHDTKELVIYYHDGSGTTHTASVDVADLFNEWTVDNNHDGGVKLHKISAETGVDILSAEVVISNRENNILKNDNGVLYVDGSQITSTTESLECTQSELKAFEISIYGNEIQNCGADFIYQPPSTSHYLGDATNLNNAVNTLDARLSETSASTITISTNLVNEINRAESAEHDLSDAIGVEQNRAISAETELNGKINAVSGDVNTLSGKIDIVSGNVNSLNTALNGKIDVVSGDVNTLSGTVESISGTVIINASTGGEIGRYNPRNGDTTITIPISTFEGGRAIKIENDEISLDLPISAGTGTNSIIEGSSGNIANGRVSHAEGDNTTASGYYSHAEGYETRANGRASHAEGYETRANNSYEHASGRYNISSMASTTFGDSGNTLFSVGNGTEESRHNAFEIRQNGDIYIVSGDTDIKLQNYLGGGGGTTYTAGRGIDITNDVISLNLPIYSGAGENSIIESYENIASGNYSHAEGEQTIAGGQASHAEGSDTQANGVASHAEGNGTTASGTSSHSEGDGTIASGNYSHAEGYNTTATGYCSHAEGEQTIAGGQASHAEGSDTQANGQHSHAEGNGTTASGDCSHSEGDGTIASGNYSHAEGSDTQADGYASHAEGDSTTANGDYSHAEGNNTTANGYASHAEGRGSDASGDYSHAEGYETRANNSYEHASGRYNVSYSASTNFGDGGNTLFSVGNGTAVDARHNAFEIRQNGDIYIVKNGSDVKLQDQLGGGGGGASVVELTNYSIRSEVPPANVYTIGGLPTESKTKKEDGMIDTIVFHRTDGGNNYSYYTGHHVRTLESGLVYNISNIYSEVNVPSDIKALFGHPVTAGTGTNSVIEGSGTTASGDDSHAEGNGTTASGDCSHAEGYNTTATGYCSHAEGNGTTASSDCSHSEGNGTIASGTSSHAEGFYTTASGTSSHAEGYYTKANGEYSHAEGNGTKANGEDSHAEGDGTIASGYYSHAEGNSTTASGSSSHAEGQWTTANGDYSHAEGYETRANNSYEHASGYYNVSNTGISQADKTLFSVGNGTEEDRHNAFEIRQNGNVYISGDLSVSGIITANGSIYSSDINLKENIVDVDSLKTSLANKIQTKEFNFKDDPNKAKVYGVIAQDLEENGLIEIVYTKNDGFKAVDYTSLMMLKIAYLENENKALKTQLEDILKRLENLEK